jgi:hypothetical protein
MFPLPCPPLFAWRAMKRAALWRHMILVELQYGPPSSPQKRAAILRHMALVDAVYGPGW